MSKRVILIVLDSVGIGALPDAAEFGDEGSNTIGNIVRAIPEIRLPNLTLLGLGNIEADSGLDPVPNPKAAFGKAKEVSAGKDTTTGHWEIAGRIVRQVFPVYPNGFPPELMKQFEQKIQSPTLGNKVASGTVIIEELGEEHCQTGFPIVYTSADSVFQIAMHEEIIPVKQQYEICRAARELLQGPHAVSRVIARPFTGFPGNFSRTSNRKDFSLPPEGETVCDLIQKAGKEVIGVGKIEDIFAGVGITRSYKTKNNQEGITTTVARIREESEGLIFTNLVDFDMLYGHRRNAKGYANALMEFDARLPEILNAMKEEDILFLTADHGNDPTFRGTDHTREYIPILVYGEKIKPGISLGTRSSFSDIGASVSEILGVGPTSDGLSFHKEILI